MNEFKIDPNLLGAEYKAQIALLSEQLVVARAAFGTLQRMYEAATKPSAGSDEQKAPPS